ncbi:DUF5129 domain-containing protein [Corynebacterium choanae]|uniref:DUF5129 domain-containing protein n=1 Tax=Corynebacterium choanae TaxID=1862358 RepID=A0A3G6J3A7_9CORY|nr:DUF5129 domain-containing protein [Corynebacterium choanae]AZA12545.1 hypothetical protein CCHOA_00580 [Corynebacterium choanae]
MNQATHHVSHPLTAATVGRRLAAAAGISALLLCSSIGITNASADTRAATTVVQHSRIPAAASTLPATPLIVAQAAPATAVRTTTIYDPAGHLSAADQDLLQQTVATADLPAMVNTVAFLVFPDNADNFNDTIRDYVEHTNDTLISQDRQKYAPGSLIFAIGLDPRRIGVYGGDDVLTALDYYGPGREAAIHGAIRDVLRSNGDPNFALAFTQGLTAAADTNRREENTTNGSGRILGFLSLGFIGLCVGGAGVYSMRKRRENNAKLAKRFGKLQREFTEVAMDLPSLDVRAHSLQSALADDRLRHEWENLRDDFLALDAFVGSGATLDPANNDPKAFAKVKTDITAGEATVQRMRRAKKQIDDLFAVENGDNSARLRRVNDLYDDATKALGESSGQELKGRLADLLQEITSLREAVDDPSFIDRYIELVDRYKYLLQWAENELTDLTKDRSKHPHRYSEPQLGDKSWRVGNYVPYIVLQDWNTSAYEANHRSTSSNSSSGFTSGYSSSGFSGGGSSSSW